MTQIVRLRGAPGGSRHRSGRGPTACGAADTATLAAFGGIAWVAVLFESVIG